MPEPTPSAVRRVLRGTLITDSARTPDALVALDEGRVLWSGPASQAPAELVEAAPWSPPGASADEELILAPGLVDQHHHGCFGMDFGAAEESEIRETLPQLHATGTTTVVASLVTATLPHLISRLDLLASLVAEGLLAGVHLEGPFLAEGRCGAHDPGLLRHPTDVDLEPLLTAGRGSLRSITYAPELSGGEDLARRALTHGLVPSVGHTQAPFDVAARALRGTAEALQDVPEAPSGRRPTVTHLFNAMDPLHHRAPGTIAASLRSASRGEAVVELIADGVHLDDATALSVFDLVGGENIALVTDSMAAAGLADGPYRLGALDVVVADGVARLAPPQPLPEGEPLTTSIAGGTATLFSVVDRMVAAGVPLEAALGSASGVPARALGLTGPDGAAVGTLRAGAAADVVVLREPDRGGEPLELMEVLRGGEPVRAGS